MRLAGRDAVLVRRVLSGKREAFEPLVERYYPTVYAVAYARTGDRVEAQDIAQETFLKAFSTLDTLRDAERFGAWAIGIARNLALSFVRARELRHPRDAKVIELRGEPDVETRDIHRFIREELASLDEDDREVLVLHYFTGLSTREIADTVGISRENAKKRLQRARDALSKLVAAEIGPALKADQPRKDDMQRVMGAVAGLPMSWATGAGVTGAGGATVVGGIAGMWKIVAMLALLLAGLVSVFVVRSTNLRAHGDDVKVVSSQVVASATKSSGQNAAPPNADASKPIPAQVTKSSENANGDAMLLCEVLDTSMNPVADAQVTVVRMPRYRSVLTEDEQVHRSGRTDARGWVIFGNLPAGNYFTTAAYEELMGFAVDRYGSYHIDDYAVSRIILDKVSTVVGEVRDQSGSPIPHAKVSLERYRSGETKSGFELGWLSTGTGTDGRFSLAVPYAEERRLVVEADGFATQRTDYISASTSATIVLTRGETATAHVHRSTDNAPTANVDVWLETSSLAGKEYRSRTDASGVALFSNLQPGEYNMFASDGKLIHPADDTPLTIQAGVANDFVVAVEPGITLSGHVIEGESKTSVPGCELELSQTSQYKEIRQRVITDHDGRFVVDGLRKEDVTWRVLKTPQGFVSENRDEMSNRVSLSSLAEMVTINIHDERKFGGIVDGRVVDEAGSPVPRAFVRASVMQLNFRSTVRASVDGTYRFAGIPVTGDLQLAAFLPGFASGSKGPLTVTADGLADQELVLKPTGGVCGRVVADSGKTITEKGFEVHDMDPWRNGAGWYCQAYLGKEGQFRLSDLPAGERKLSWESDETQNHTGLREAAAVVTVKPRENIEGVVIQYHDIPRVSAQTVTTPRPPEPPRWSLKGRVIRADSGAAVTDFSLSVKSMGVSYSPGPENSGGRFQRDGCRGPEIILTVDAPGFRRYVQRVTSDEAKNHEITVALNSGCVVQGAVVDQSGKPIPGTHVCVGEMPMSDVELSKAASTQSDGTFRLDTLDVKPTTLFVIHPAFAMSSTSITPNPSSPVHVKIALSLGGRIEGNVSLGGKPLVNPGLSFFVKPHQRYQKSVRGDADGHFVIDHLPTGVVSVAAFVPGAKGEVGSSRFQKHEVSVTDGEATRLDIAFDEATGHVEGMITGPDGKPLMGSVDVSMQRDGAFEYASSVSNSGVDAQGHYRTGDLPAGEVVLRVMAHVGDNVVLTKHVTVNVPEGTTVTQDIAFAGAGIVAGKVTGLSQGETFMVVVVPGDVSVPSKVESAQDFMVESVAWVNGSGDSYRVEGLEPGAYMVHAISTAAHDEALGPPRFVSQLVSVGGGEQVVDLDLGNT